MPRKDSKSPKRRLPVRKKLDKPIFRDVTVDEVIKDLLQLFGHLGLDASHIVRKVKDVDIPATRTVRHYPHLSTIGDLLTLWHQDPRYLDQAGDPVAIRMQGVHRSFRDLAERTAPSISAKQLLSELEKLGAVNIASNGAIRATMRTLPVYQDEQFAIAHTLNSLRGFIRTLSHNLNSGPSNADQLFHRIAWNGEMDLGEIPRLKIWLKRHGQSLLESTDNWMIGRTGMRRTAPKKSNRVAQVSVGIYLAVEEQ